MTDGLFRREVTEGKSQRLWGEVIILQPLSFTLLSAGVTLIVALMIALLFFGSYVRRETVNGYLKPNNGLVKVYARSPGVISDKQVMPGDLVETGGALLTVSTGRSSKEVSDIDGKIISELMATQLDIEEKIAQDKQLNRFEIKKIESQIKGLKKDISQLKIQVSTTKKIYSLSQERLESVENLKRQGHVSDNQYKEQQEALLDYKLNYYESLRLLTTQTNSLESSELELVQLPSQHIMNQVDLRTKVSELKQRRLDLEGQRTFTINAPTAGRVTSLQAHVGQAISINTPILAILPVNAIFQAELFVPTRAIGFISAGQKVMIRYAAFPYQRYGLYEGEIASVAQSILTPEELPIPIVLDEPVYRVTVNLSSQQVSAYGQDMTLQAGMTLEADIILDSLSLLDWLLDPLYSLTGRT